MARVNARTVDEYLSALSPDKRAALEQLRRTIKAVVPRAEECISYQIPAFRLDGKMLVWFGAGSDHCAFYPGGVVQKLAHELTRFKTSKGTVRFQPDTPLPSGLVRKLVKARIAATAAARRQTSPRRPASGRSAASRSRARRRPR